MDQQKQQQFPLSGTQKYDPYSNLRQYLIAELAEELTSV
jgi:hypothetical protein